MNPKDHTTLIALCIWAEKAEDGSYRWQADAVIADNLNDAHNLCHALCLRAQKTSCISPYITPSTVTNYIDLALRKREHLANILHADPNNPTFIAALEHLAAWLPLGLKSQDCKCYHEWWQKERAALAAAANPPPAQSTFNF